MSSRSVSPWLAVAGIFGGIVLVGAAAHQVSQNNWERRIRMAYAAAARGLGVDAPRLVFSDHVPNAQSDGAVVAINVSWARRVLSTHCRDDVCTDQVLVGVLAHELAHHAYQHARDLRDVVTTQWEMWTRHGFELDADRAAGAALARLELGANEFARVLTHLSRRASATHPLGRDRVEAIREGYHGWVWV